MKDDDNDDNSSVLFEAKEKQKDVELGVDDQERRDEMIEGECADKASSADSSSDSRSNNQDAASGSSSEFHAGDETTFTEDYISCNLTNVVRAEEGRVKHTSTDLIGDSFIAASAEPNQHGASLVDRRSWDELEFHPTSDDGDGKERKKKDSVVTGAAKEELDKRFRDDIEFYSDDDDGQTKQKKKTSSDVTAKKVDPRFRDYVPYYPNDDDGSHFEEGRDETGNVLEPVVTPTVDAVLSPIEQLQKERDKTVAALEQQTGNLIYLHHHQDNKKSGSDSNVPRRWNGTLVFVPLAMMPVVLGFLIFLVIQEPATSIAPTTAPTVASSQAAVFRDFENGEDLRHAVKIYLDLRNPNRTNIVTTYGHGIGNWKVHQVADFSRVFSVSSLSLLEGFNEPLQDWNMSKATSLRSMFQGAKIFDQDLSRWDVSSVQDMGYVFEGAASFTGKGIDEWKVSRVTTMENMFDGAPSLRCNFSAWDTSGVTSMDSMFRDAFVEELPGARGLSSWNTARVKTMKHMLQGSESFNDDLSGWNVAQVIDMTAMFAKATSFNQDLHTWNTTGLSKLHSMFLGATSFNGRLDGWQTGQASSMYSLFLGATAFNQDLSTWDTSSVSSFSRFFEGALAFNGDISTWNTWQVTDFSFMFKGASHFNQALSNLDTSRATKMEGMFEDAIAFNGDVSGFVVDRVESMKRMFANASSFRPTNMDDWEPRAATTFVSMFEEASSFDADLCVWDNRIQGIVSESDPFENMFSGTACPNPSTPSQSSSNGQNSFCHDC